MDWSSQASIRRYFSSYSKYFKVFLCYIFKKLKKKLLLCCMAQIFLCARVDHLSTAPGVAVPFIIASSVFFFFLCACVCGKILRTCTHCSTTDRKQKRRGGLFGKHLAFKDLCVCATLCQCSRSIAGKVSRGNERKTRAPLFK